jgi:hypothetical protein
VISGPNSEGAREGPELFTVWSPVNGVSDNSDKSVRGADTRDRERNSQLMVWTDGRSVQSVHLCTLM